MNNINTNQNNKILYPRGSEWRKWDLHVHTPSSAVSNFKSWESYIKKLNEITKRKDIHVLGITDYFSVEGYKKIIDSYQDKLENVNLLLPNVEFRLDNIVYRRGKREPKRLNFHAIFSNKVKIEDIENQFLGDLHFYKGSGNAGELSKIKLEKSAIEKYGKECKKQKEFENDSDLEAGAKNVVFKIDEIISVLKNKPDYFKGKYLLFLESEFWSDIDWGQDYGLRKTLLQISHGIFSSNQNDIKWFLGRDTDYYSNQQKFIEEFGRLFPCIHGSDAHSEKELESRPDLDRYCWIKADPTFEGLKQIIYEPEERVYIGKSPPKSKNDAKIIDRIEIRNSNNWFEEESTLLNEDFVSIIGEKGAGKTALADFIALTGGDFDVKGKDPGSFIFKALKSSKQIEKTIENCAITIFWRDGNLDSITITEDFKYYRDLKKVRYLSQSFIERKCNPEQAEELQKEVENIIFQYIPVQDRMGQTTFIDLKKKNTQSIQLKKSRCKEEIANFNSEIFNIEEEINSLKAKKEEKNKLKTEIEQLEKQKPKPTTKEEKNIERKLGLLNKRKIQLNEQIAAYKTQLSTIETIRTKVEALKTYVDKQLVVIKNDLESIGLANLYEKLKFSVSSDFNDELNNKKREIETQVQEFQGVEEVKEQIIEGKSKKSMEVDLNTLTNDYISKLPLSKISVLISTLESKSSLAEDKRKTIRLFEEKIEKNHKRINELEKSIKDIEDTKKPLLHKKVKERDEEYKNYFILLQEEKKVLEELYAPLRKKLDKEDLGEKNKIEFFARIELDVENFFNKADSIIDFSRTGRYFRKRDLLFKEIKTISEKIEFTETLDIYNLIILLYKTFEEDEDNPIDISEQLLRGRKKIDFYNWIFDISDFSVTYSIKYQGTNIELLSPGKKGIVLLLMYLVLDTESSIPLIIDQPEENLDNKSIYPYLINYFKKAKKRRQIIVITHNPNLVLNTDAEQIVVANFEAIPHTQDARIRYISGAIENSFVSEKAKIPIEKQGIKEHGIDILEGGPEAFGKREDRYEIERLKK